VVVVVIMAVEMGVGVMVVSLIHQVLKVEMVVCALYGVQIEHSLEQTHKIINYEVSI
jgi:hypothetical protein